MVRAASTGIFHVCPTLAACSGSPGTAYVVMLLPVELRTRTSRRLGLSGTGALSTARTTSVPSVTAGACDTSEAAGDTHTLPPLMYTFHVWLGLAACSGCSGFGDVATPTYTPVGSRKLTTARSGLPATGAASRLATTTFTAVHLAVDAAAAATTGRGGATTGRGGATAGLVVLAAAATTTGWGGGGTTAGLVVLAAAATTAGLVVLAAAATTAGWGGGGTTAGLVVLAAAATTAGLVVAGAWASSTGAGEG